MARVRNWCFVLNIREDWEELAPPLDPTTFTYMVAQLERASTTGQLHWQGYVQFPCAMRLRALKTINQYCRWEVARSSPEWNQEYCIKICIHKWDPEKYGLCTVPDCHEGGRVPGTEVCILGKPKAPGQRTDIIALRTAVKTGKKLFDIVEDDALLYVIARYPRLYNTLKMVYRRPPQFRERPVLLKYGPPGVGKSREGFSLYWDNKQIWIPISGASKIWFDHYDDEKVAQFDDFLGAASHMALDVLLRMLSGHPFIGDAKGGSCWFDPERIIFTTNVKPTFWYDFTNRELQYAALLSRFTEIWVFTAPGTWTTLRRVSRADPGPDYLHHFPLEYRTTPVSV